MTDDTVRNQFMLDALKVGAAVTTPLGLIGFVVALVYFLRARQLKNEETALRMLSPEDRPKNLDQTLTRYNIDAGNATREQKFKLISDEMAKRHRRDILRMLISA